MRVEDGIAMISDEFRIVYWRNCSWYYGGKQTNQVKVQVPKTLKIQNENAYSSGVPKHATCTEPRKNAWSGILPA